MNRWTVKRGIVLSVAVFLTLVPSAAAAPIDEALAVLDEAVDTFNARDLDTHMTLFTDDVEVFTGIDTPLLFKGKAAWKAFHDEVAMLPLARFQHHTPTARIYGGDTVVVNAYFSFTVFDEDGQAETQGGRYSTTLVKQEGKWLIANYHFSAFF